ncbi:MAG: riboflavin biosynthesis protein RibF [Deltaproteobacteria bacterium]|nr:MAG: riboflavin biosynthesis protein RibF [Deltaproteobacteria bacterium]
MKIIRQLDEIDKQITKACVTIGNFDGVHRGHQLLFNRVVQRARRLCGVSVAVTFDPHPLQVLRPGGIRQISTIQQKIELIEISGLDVLIIVPFDREFASITAERFVDEILLGKIGMQELVVGYDYAFGKGRCGDTDFLERQGEEKHFPVEVVKAHYEDKILVSSSRVREVIMAGDMETAMHLLGRYYQIRGTVQNGCQRGGAELGFPTANLVLNPEGLVPLHGVYAVQAVYDGRCYGGVVNIGFNPTFAGKKLVAETHIFDFDKDIYGKPIKINFIKYLRGEQKFSGIEELGRQIGRDAAQAKEILVANSLELSLACHEKFNR